MPSRRRVAVAVLALASALGASLPGAAVSGPRLPRHVPAHVTGRVLVKLSPGASAAAIHRRAGGRLIRHLDGLPGWQVVRVPKSLSVDRAVRLYRSLPGVAVAEPDFIASAASEPDDPCLPRACTTVDQWNLYEIGAPLAWEAFPGRTFTAADKLASDPVVVAVADTQIDIRHPDFVNAGGTSPDIVSGGQIDVSTMRTWVEETKTAGPSAYHGTYVAGILGAATGNGRDVASMGYSSVILPLTVLDGNGKAPASSLAEAIAYAHANGAQIINLSLGMEADSQAVRDAITGATTSPRASLVVAAAGNNAKDRPYYPGSYPEVMSVSGFDSSRRLASCSNYNDNVSVSAPARHVSSLAPMPERQRVVDCGTSAAAPHVSGLAALLWGQDRTRTAADVRRIIEQAADDDTETPGRDPKMGFGRINADRALHLNRGPVVSQVTSTLATRGGSTSTIKAVARSDRPITAAEVYLNRPGHEPARLALKPEDGVWGGTTEHLTGTIHIPATNDSALHALFVRARDGEWGAAERGRLAIDRSPPEIVNVRVPTTIRSQKATVSFVLRDAFSERFTYTVNITDPAGTTVWMSPTVPAGRGPQDLYWTPPLTSVPGQHVVEIYVWDEAGNPAAATAAQLVV